jgi:hypothetical protein
MIKIGRRIRIIAFLSLWVFITIFPGCTNVREVETLSRVEEPLTSFIGEKEAIKAVARIPDVTSFRRFTATPCLIQVEQHPTVKDPVYIIRVVEDQHDHLVLYGLYMVDAYNGQVME